MREQALLAILDAGPIAPADLALMSRWHRKRARDGIDTLIAALDALDDDPDLEDGGDDEPTMSRRETGSGQQAPEAASVVDECEPSLGAPEVEFNVSTRRIDRHGHIDQRRWADGGSGHDDGEPTLGSREGSADDWHWPGQLAWSVGYQLDPQHDEIEDVSEDEGADV